MNTDEHRFGIKSTGDSQSAVRSASSRSLAIVCSLLTAICSLFVGCRSRDSVAPLQIGIIAPSSDYLPLKVAEQGGLLAGQKLQYQQFNSGWELGVALTAGRVDMAILPFTYVISAVAQGYPIRTVGCLEHESDGIIARPGISRLDELAGKKVGCLRASTIELLLRQALDRRGIKSELVYFASPMDMWAALERGDVSALSIYVPGIVKADRAIGNVIFWYREDQPMHPCCDVAVNQDRIRTRTGAVRRFMASLAQGAEATGEDTARAVQVAARTYNLSDSVALLTIRRSPFRLSLTDAEKDFELAVARQMKELGYIPRDVTARELYRTDLLTGTTEKRR